MFKPTVEAMAAEERAKHHNNLADRLEENLCLANARPKSAELVRSFDGGHGGLLYEIEPRRALSSDVTRNLRVSGNERRQAFPPRTSAWCTIQTMVSSEVRKGGLL